jgi:hypothetical protein
VDVGVEVAGAPEHDHPDREHEDQGKGCEHSRVLPDRRFWQIFFSFYAMPTEPAMVFEPLAIEPLSDAL